MATNPINPFENYGKDPFADLGVDPFADLSPNTDDVRKKAKDVVDIGLELDAPFDLVDNYHPFLVGDPQGSFDTEPNYTTDAISGMGFNMDFKPLFKPEEPVQKPTIDEAFSTQRIEPMPTQPLWTEYKKFWVGEKRTRLGPPSNIEKFDDAFNAIVGQPLRIGLKFAKGMTFGASDLAWAAVKHTIPEDVWVDEVKNMTLDEAMDWAAGYNPTGFQKSLGEVSEFAGRIKSVYPLAKTIGINAPRTMLEAASNAAKVVGLTSTANQMSKLASQKIDPTSAEYGFEGPIAVVRDIAYGAIFSAAFYGVGQAFKSLTPNERGQALKILGLKEGATEAEIAKAVRNQARKFHPDKVKGMGEEFNRVIKARDTLRNGQQLDIVYRGKEVSFKGKNPDVAPKATSVTKEITGVKPPAEVTALAKRQSSELGRPLNVFKDELSGDWLTQEATPDVEHKVIEPEIITNDNIQNKNEKPSDKELADSLVNAGLMREADIGKKQFAYTYRKIITNNKWLTAKEINDKANGGNAGKTMNQWKDAGVVQQMYKPDGTPVYAWPGVIPTSDLLTIEQIEAKEKPKSTVKRRMKQAQEIKNNLKAQADEKAKQAEIELKASPEVKPGETSGDVSTEAVKEIVEMDEIPSGRDDTKLFVSKDVAAATRTKITKAGKGSLGKNKSLLRGSSLKTPSYPSKAKGKPLVKRAAKAISKERFKSYHLQGALVDGENLVFTDAKRVHVTKGKWGEDGIYDYKKSGELVKNNNPEAKFPKYKDTLPDYSKYSEVDTEKLWRQVREALLTSTNDVVVLMENPDGSIGLASANSDIGMMEVNIKDGAIEILPINGKYLLEALELHTSNGDDVINLYYPDEVQMRNKAPKPIMTTGDKSTAVLMQVETKETLAETKEVISVKAERLESNKGKVEGINEKGEKVYINRRESGQTTLIPDLAQALVHAAKKFKNPVELVQNTAALIKRNTTSAASYMKTLGDAGEQLSEDIDDITFQVTKQTNRDAVAVRNVYKGTNREVRENISKTVNGRIDDPSGFIQDKADKLRDILDRSMNEANMLGMERRLSDGTKIPVGGLGKAFPQVPNAEGIAFLDRAAEKGMSDSKVFEWANEQVEKGKYESVQEAIHNLQKFRDSLLRGMNPYFESFRVELPDEYIEWDGSKTLPKLFERNWMTIEGVRKWGNDFELVSALTENISIEYGTDKGKMVKSFIETSFGKSPGISREAKKVRDIVVGYQFFSKVALSPLTIIRNMADRIPKGMMDSPVSTLRAMAEYPPFINGFLGWSQKLEEEMIKRGAIFSHGSLTEGFETDNAIAEAFKTPFASSERGNQVFIAVVRYHKLKADLVKVNAIKPGFWENITNLTEGLFSTKKAAEIRIGDRIMEKVNSGETISVEDVNKFLHEAVQNRAFPMLLDTKPIWWDSSVLGRLFSQFKTWTVRQTNMIWNDVVKYTVKTGDVSRLVNFLAGTLVAGEIYNIARDLITGRKESVTSQLQTPNPELGRALLNDLLDGGVVGMLADFTYGIFDWASGVSARTAANTWDVALNALEATELTPEAIERLVEREVSPYRQAKHLLERYKESRDPLNISSDYFQAKSEVYRWKFKQDNGTTPSVIKSYTHDVMFGQPSFQIGENTLAYEMIQRSIISGDIKEASEYALYVITNSKEPVEAIRGLRSSMNSRSPFGSIPAKERGLFVKSQTYKDYNDINQQFIEMYIQAIELAADKFKETL